MNILICDDLPEETAALEKLLLQSGYPVDIKQCCCASDALDYLNTGALIHLCFFDIVMPDMSGIQLAEQFRQQGFNGEIVFLSTSKDYGPESYAVGALSYLLKPPTANALTDILRKLYDRRDNADHMEIVIKTSGITKVIPHRDISHAEAMGHTVILHMKDASEIPVSAAFLEIAGELQHDSRFIRCHRSYVVNMQDVAEISEREILTRSGKRIPIARSYPDTRTKFYKWKFGGEWK